MTTTTTTTSQVGSGSGSEIRCGEFEGFRIRVVDSRIEGRKGDQVCTFERRKGRTLTYVFDRTFQFYLLLEEFVFPVAETIGNPRQPQPVIPQRIVILDGEIVENLIHHRLNYSVFDVVAVSDCRKVISCNRMNMSEKLTVIKEKVVDPHHTFYRDILKCPSPRALMIIRKHFYRKDEIDLIFRCIERRVVSGGGGGDDTDAPKKCIYVYKNYNHNDGIVFTPESVKFYSFVPGSCPNLLKWKWPDKLTCDFNATVESGPNRTSVVVLHFYAMDRHVRYRATNIQPASLSPLAQEKLRTRKMCILECLFRPETADWEVLCERLDKVKANSFLTVSGVLRNQIEGISESELSQALQSSEWDAVGDAEQDRLFEAAVGNRLIPFRLQFMSNKTQNPFLGVSVRTSSGGVKVLFIARVKQCVYDRSPDDGDAAPVRLSGDDLQAQVMKDCLEPNVAAPTDVVAECVFLPFTALWKIVSFKRGNLDSVRDHAAQVLRSHELMVIEADKLRTSQRKRQLVLSEGVDVASEQLHPRKKQRLN